MKESFEKASKLFEQSEKALLREDYDLAMEGMKACLLATIKQHLKNCVTEKEWELFAEEESFIHAVRYIKNKEILMMLEPLKDKFYSPDKDLMSWSKSDVEELIKILIIVKNWIDTDGAVETEPMANVFNAPEDLKDPVMKIS